MIFILLEAGIKERKNILEKYSVLMSVYAKEKPEYLKDSIQSILQQTEQPSEFILVKDGLLTAELDQVINIFTIQYPSLFLIVSLEKNQGIATALNEGLKQCHYELVARMDSDDIAVPDRCKWQLEIFSAQDVDIVGGIAAEFESNPKQIISYRKLPEKQEEILSFARRRNPFNHSCVMFRKSAVLAVGGYHFFRFFEDYDLWVRMLRNGAKGYNLPKVLVHMRVGNGLYHRRGGLQYVIIMVKFRWYLFHKRFTNFLDFLVCTLGQTCVCFMPEWARKLFYKKMLRNSNSDPL
ncbi:glycosyltransferase [bacterium 1XD42-1]|nr:glycosyltransferase [bacterium 1XD42-8]RKJ62848.1 glycosyltransferase [bacterium 1XD42-1]